MSRCCCRCRNRCCNNSCNCNNCSCNCGNNSDDTLTILNSNGRVIARINGNNITCNDSNDNHHDCVLQNFLFYFPQKGCKRGYFNEKQCSVKCHFTVFMLSPLWNIGPAACILCRLGIHSWREPDVPHSAYLCNYRPHPLAYDRMERLDADSYCTHPSACIFFPVCPCNGPHHRSIRSCCNDCIP